MGWSSALSSTLQKAAGQYSLAGETCDAMKSNRGIRGPYHADYGQNRIVDLRFRVTDSGFVVRETWGLTAEQHQLITEQLNAAFLRDACGGAEQ